MKNFGIKTKKFVRKITAIASAALMAGLSVGAAAADLSSLSSTFITNGNFNSYVVVGTGGGSNVAGFAKDVAGSVVVAAAFAQQAKTTTGSSGSATLSRNITTGYLNGSRVAIGGSGVPAETWTNGKTGFSWLPNATVVNSSGNAIANQTAVLSVASGLLKLGTDGKYVLTNGGIVYNLTFNNLNTETSGSKAVGNYTSGILFPDGKSYQITNWTYSGTGTAGLNVSLGEYTVVKNIGLNSVQTIGTTGLTFVITGATTTPKAQVLITDSNGNKLVDSVFWAKSDHYENTSLGVDIRLKDLNVLTDGTVKAEIEWSTSATKLVNGESISKWPNWTIWMTADNAVPASATGITSIAWVYKQTSPGYIRFDPSSSISMFDGYFSLTGEPLVINSTDKKQQLVTVTSASSSGWEVSFIDENGTSHFIDLTSKINLALDASTSDVQFNWIDNLAWQFKCSSSTNANLTNLATQGLVDIDNGTPFTLSRTSGNLTGYTATGFALWEGCAGGRVNITLLNFTSDSGVPMKSNLTYSLMYDKALGAANSTVFGNSSSASINGTLTLLEGGSKVVNITYERGSIPSTGVDTTDFENVIETTGSMFYTSTYGTILNRVSSSEISILYPDSFRIGKLAIGRGGEKNYELTTGQYDSDLDVTLKAGAGSSVTINKIDVGLAKLDSELTSSSLDKPVVLLGGSAVNSLVSELVSAGKVSFGSLSDNKALVQLVDNAFNSKSALVIAGWAGEDTRLAAQVVASQVLGTDMGLTGSSVVLNTGVSNYADVTVI